MSIVVSESKYGLPSRKCDDMPDPCPITAARFAFGACASVSIGSISCVASSLSMRRVEATFGTESNHTMDNDASGLPLVASEYSGRPVAPFASLTLTVAVRPSA